VKESDMPNQRIHITEVDAGQQGALAVQLAHLAIVELQRDAAEQSARVEQLTRWTGADREAARIQEVAASDDTRY
jgi:hypothetical protein